MASVTGNTKELEKELNLGTSGEKFHYGVVRISDDPVLRLPCYNVAMQCAYEMVEADVGDFIANSNGLYSFARKTAYQK